MHWLTRLARPLLFLLIVGCARASTSAPADATPAGRSSDVITAQELASSAVVGGDALEAVRRLRPRFLATRGLTSIKIANAGSVHVSVNGGSLLGLTELSRMQATDLSEIRYLSARDAAQRFGTSAGSGAVLLVKTR